MGKTRIHAMLARNGGHLSALAVGRIIGRALAAGRSVVRAAMGDVRTVVVRSPVGLRAATPLSPLV